MSKRAGLSARSRALLVTAVVVLGALAAVPAFAAVQPPTTNTIDSNAVVVDNYINAAEWDSFGVTVTGTYAGATTLVHVRLLNSATCNPSATQQMNKFAPGPDASFGGGTFSVTFTFADLNGSGLAGDPSDDLFSEGATLCARTRANDGTPNEWNDFSNSTNRPVKDTTLPQSGTATLVDPNNDGFMNAAEATAGSIGLQWTGVGDATTAELSLTDTANVIPDPSCGPLTGRLATGSEAMSTTCAAALPQLDDILGTPFNLRVIWFDSASNPSPAADCVAFVGCDELIKDVVAPLAPTVSLDTNPINASNQTAVSVCGNAEDNATVEIRVFDVANPTNEVTGTTVANQTPTCSIAADYKAVFNVDTLPDGNVAAGAKAIDPAGNIGPETVTANVPKDAVIPAKPVVELIPSLITASSQQFVEVSVGGEAGTNVTVTLSDHTNQTLILATVMGSSNHTVGFFDVTDFADGPVKATVTLTDAVGNVSDPGIDTALKDVYSPLVKINNPAPDELTKGAVTISGTGDPAVRGGLGQVEVVLVTGATETRLGTAPIQGNGSWSLSHTFATSGPRIIKARATRDSSGQVLTFRPADPGLPSEFTADHRFNVDAANPTSTTSNGAVAVYMPGDPIVIEGTAADDFSGVLAVEYRIFDLKGFDNRGSLVIGRELDPNPKNASCPSCDVRYVSKNVTWSQNLTTLLPAGPGQYYVQLVAIDIANNRQTNPTIVTFIKL